MNEAAAAWGGIIVPSLIVGAFCGRFIRSRLSLFVSGAIPWFGFLGVLLYYEYFVPYQGGGASMWPIAQLFGGTVAAGCGMITCQLTRQYCRKTAGKPDADDS